MYILSISFWKKKNLNWTNNYKQFSNQLDDTEQGCL